jgi:hypothetical protein
MHLKMIIMNKAILIISFFLFAQIAYSQQTGCISGDCDNGYGTYVFPSGEKYVGNWVNLKRKGFGTNYWVSGDWYRGDWLDDKKHGQGTYQYKNGDKYVGQYQNDKKHGEGTMYLANGTTQKGFWSNDIYQGTTSNTNVVVNTNSGCISGDCDNGYGTYVFESGEKYVGNWVNLLRKGFGTNYWVSGDWYRGDWLDDKRHGEGTYQYKNGDKYVGQWKNDKQDGEGTFFYANGTIQKGYYANGTYVGSNNTNIKTEGCISGDCDNGYGTYVFKSGEKYEGNWKNDKRNGFGTNYFLSGEWYKGEWKEDKRHGQGLNYYNNGEKYDGQWFDDKKQGYGTYTYLSGETQVGMWENNKYVGTGKNNYGCISGDCKNGYGVYTWDSGEKYVGNFKNGLRNGQGVNYWADGWIHDGEWKEDRQHGYGNQTDPQGTKKTGFWDNGKYIGTNVAKSGCISGDCQNGSGTYITTSGDKYEGLFKNGIYDGQGTYTYASGDYYVGELKSGKFEGEGAYYMVKTGEKYIGSFARGTYNGVGTYYYSNGQVKAGLWKEGVYAGSTQKNLAKPEVSWVTPGYANTETDKSDATVKICVKSAEELQNFQVYVNDKLQVDNATRGFSVVSSSCDYTIERSVKLDPGDNRIKVVAVNGAGKTESTIRTIKYTVVSNSNQKRYALVIGNSNYATAPLKNPVNDAKAIGDELKNMNFDVMVYTNLSANEMKTHIRTFGDKLTKNKGVGLFFFAGHGMQVNGENYLIPVDAKIEKEMDVELESVNLKRLLGEMEYAQNDLNIIILDACRNNPFARSFRSGGNQGLATTLAPTGTFIAYATAPGSVASDGVGQNGLYTQELLKAMRKPNVKIEDMFKEVRKHVYEQSEKKQTPWENSSIFGDFYFKQ